MTRLVTLFKGRWFYQSVYDYYNGGFDTSYNDLTANNHSLQQSPETEKIVGICLTSIEF